MVVTQFIASITQGWDLCSAIELYAKIKTGESISNVNRGPTPSVKQTRLIDNKKVPGFQAASDYTEVISVTASTSVPQPAGLEMQESRKTQPREMNKTTSSNYDWMAPSNKSFGLVMFLTNFRMMWPMNTVCSLE
jgi:hypothetical protein